MHFLNKVMSQLVMLLVLVSNAYNSFAGELPSNLAEEVVTKLMLASDDNNGLERRAKETVSSKKLAESLACIHKEVGLHLAPMYMRHINSLYTEAEQREVLRTIGSGAWRKAREIESARLSKILGEDVGNSSATSSLTPEEKKVIEQFSESDLGVKLASYVYSLFENNERGEQLEVIKRDCIEVYAHN